jgi:DNA repair protein RecN (Recombination protein N)
LLERLKRKHGPTLHDVLASQAALERQLDLLRHADERRAGIEAEALSAREAFMTLARALSKKRRATSSTFGRKVQELLAELAMGRTQFEMRFEVDVPESAWSDSGIDVAECYLSANVGEDLRPLARIASGGELSRVMLAIRTLAAADAPGKTLIFDEIDAGIGGRVASEVGKKLSRIGRSFQVLCITHLPQIAAAGHAHFHISKTVADGRTHTRVVRLNGDDRVEEVARMIAGEAPTDASRATARELLEQGRNHGSTPAMGAGESEVNAKGESERGRSPKSKTRK